MKTVTVIDGVEMTRELWAKKITECWQSSIESILETGRNLIAAKDELEHGEWITMIRNELPFNEKTAQRLIKVATNKVISNGAHVHHLPASWGTLYELTKLDDKVLEKKIEAGEINPATQRKDITEMLKLPNSERSKSKLERIERERPDLFARIKKGELSMSMADTIIASDKKQSAKAPQFQGKPSESAENAAVELAEILLAYCNDNGVPKETICAWLGECNSEQVAAVITYGEAAAATKRNVKDVLRRVAEEFGYPKFEGAAFAIVKETKVPMEKLGAMIEAEDKAKKAKGGSLTREEKAKLAEKINRTPNKSKGVATL